MLHYHQMMLYMQHEDQHWHHQYSTARAASAEKDAAASAHSCKHQTVQSQPIQEIWKIIWKILLPCASLLHGLSLDLLSWCAWFWSLHLPHCSSCSTIIVWITTHLSLLSMAFNASSKMLRNTWSAPWPTRTTSLRMKHFGQASMHFGKRNSSATRLHMMNCFMWKLQALTTIQLIDCKWAV